MTAKAAKRQTRPVEPIDPEVQEFRESFDEGDAVVGFVKGLGHTPNAMVGAIVDAARSNGHAREAAAKSTAKFGNSGISEIPLSSIDPTPDNARKTFDQAKLKTLGADIKKRGQKQPCLVRQNGSRYVLIDGERRFRAAKLAGVHTLRCEIDNVTDEEARETGLVTNLLREDLNPIERAIGFKQLLDDGRTQGGVAALLGISQPEVSNTVRLLDLPEDVRTKVAEGLVSTTHATALIAPCKEPRFAAGFLKRAKTLKWDLGPISEFPGEIALVYRESFPVVSNYRNEHGVDEQKLAKDHAAELGLIPFKQYSNPHLAVGNAPRWKELLDKANKAAAARSDKRDSQQAAAGGSLSPSDRKKRAKDHAEQHAKRVRRWYTAWLQERIATRIDPAAMDFTTAEIKLLIHFCLSRTQQRDEEQLREVLQEVGITKVKKKGSWFHEGYSLVAALDDGRTPAATKKLLQRWVTAATEGFNAHLSPDDVLIIGREMKVDLRKEWTLDEHFLQLFNKAQLGELAIEWRCAEMYCQADPDSGLACGIRKADEVFASHKRSEAIATILDQARSRKMPVPAMLLELAKGK